MEGWRKLLGVGAVVAVALLFLTPTAASAQVITDVIVTATCPTGSPLTGGYGVSVANNTAAELDFDVSITPSGGSPVVDDPLPDVAAGAVGTVTFGPGPTADVGATADLLLEGATVTITAGAESASVILDCDLEPLDYLSGVTDCGVILVQNSGTEPIEIDVYAAVVAASTLEASSVALDHLLAALDVDTFDIPATTQDGDIITHARIDVGTTPAEQLLVEMPECPDDTTSTTAATGASTPTPATPSASNRSAAEIARTGEDDDALARVGTVVGLIGVLLLLTSNWWLRWFRDREALLADFQSWRMRGR